MPPRDFISNGPGGKSIELEIDPLGDEAEDLTETKNEPMKAIYKLHYDCGRQGTITGLFIEDTDRVNKLIASKAEVYFGEMLGKHS